MALIDLAKSEFPQTTTELAMFDSLRTEGRKFKFTSKDGKEDCINGVFQLRLRKPITLEVPLYGFDEFKAEDHANPNNRTVGVHIDKIHNNFSRLIFKPNRKNIGIAFCPDTRRNRAKLADVFFEKKIEIEGLLTAEGTVEGVVVKKEIELLALKRKAERQGRMNKADSVERIYKNLTPEQREQLVHLAIEKENANRSQIVLAPKGQVTSMATEGLPVLTVGSASQTQTTSADMAALEVKPNEEKHTPGPDPKPPEIVLNIPKVEKPVGKKFYEYKKIAKQTLVEFSDNKVLLGELKERYGEKKYRSCIEMQVAVRKLVANWFKKLS